MKMNKKGFTLIEMLVVIAIIAILVAIVIPTVTTATDKAEAASIAANLRSIKAEIATELLTVNAPATGTTATGNSGHWTFTFDATTKKVADDGIAKNTAEGATYKLPFDTESDFAIDYVASSGELTVTYQSKNIDAWAAKAETGAFPTESAGE